MEHGVLNLKAEGVNKFQLRLRFDFQDLMPLTAARDGWSTMVNVWRDYNRWRLDVYAGGGIGAGGYRSVLNVTGLRHPTHFW